MSADEKNSNEVLARLVADLFAQSKGGEDLPSWIRRLRGEITKVVQNEDTIFGKFRVLLESFREIIPDEKQCYSAAIKALSTTSKLSQEEIVSAINERLEELKMLDKGLMPAIPGWRDDLKAMETRSREIQGEITKLGEILVRLEMEQQGILTSMASRKQEVELVEKAVAELFRDIGAEITSIKKKVEEFTAASAAPSPVAPPAAPAEPAISSAPPREERKEVEQKVEVTEPAPQQDTEFQKKCPMCGGRMNFFIHGAMWQCYSCGHEEASRTEIRDDENGELTSEPGSAPDPEPFSRPSPPRAASTQAAAGTEYKKPGKKPSSTKTCPNCRKRMDWDESDRAWRCPFCEYERRID